MLNLSYSQKHKRQHDSEQHNKTTQKINKLHEHELKINYSTTCVIKTFHQHYLQ